MEFVCCEERCTGCMACYNICAFDAIHVSENEVGHYLPSIDTNKCINCGLCRKICPSQNNKLRINTPKLVYAAWAKDLNEHATSSSGGIAAAITKFILANKGVAYGCACAPKCEFKHRRVDCKNDDIELKGSKYVQSNIGYTFRTVKTDLLNGKTVLFTGTPCQVAGLYSFLGRNFDNLYTIDLVCHGVPSQKLLREHISSLGIAVENVEKISFRDGSKYVLSITDGKKELYRKNELQDIYLAGFSDSLFVRESCTQCTYANRHRIADITLGDFHGLGVNTPFTNNKEGNVSLLMINTDKGSSLIDKCQDFLVLYEREINEAVMGNSQLQHPTKRRANYQYFLRLYKKKGYRKAAKVVLRKRRIKNTIRSLYLCFTKKEQ